MSKSVRTAEENKETNTEWIRYTPYALVGAAVFAFMHVADEMAGSWDAGAAGAPMGDPTIASISMGVFTLVGMGALWWILTDRPWGYLFAALFGLQFMLTGGMHFVNPADMTTFRWIVVILEVGFAAAVLILSVNSLRVYRPWRSREAAAA